MLLASIRLLGQTSLCSVTITQSAGQLNCKEENKEITLTANASGAEAYTYAWELNGTPLALTDAEIKIQVPGTYTVRATGSIQGILQCTTTSSVIITKDVTPPIFAIQANPSSICKGQLTTLYALGAAEFLWNSGSKENAVPEHPSETTVYTLTGTGANGCSDTKSVTVTVNQPPTATMAGTEKVCRSGPQQFITFTAESGKPPFTFAYNIDGGSPVAAYTTGENTTAAVGILTGTLGKVKYSLVSVTDGNNCSQTQSGAVTTQILKEPSLISAKTMRVCNSAPFSYTAASDPEETSFTWQRVAPEGVTSTRADNGTTKIIIDSLVNNTYTTQTVKYFFFLTTRDGGCTAMDSLLVTVNPTPSINGVPDISYCNGSRVRSIKFGSPTEGASFRWTCDNSIGFGLSGRDSIPSFTASSPGNTTLKATIKAIALSADGCDGGSTYFAVTVLPAPVLTGKKDISICNNGKEFTYTALVSPENANFTWKRLAADSVTGSLPDGDTTKTIRDLLVNNTTTLKTVQYPVSMSTGNGCVVRDTFRVALNPTPSINGIPDISYCNGSQVRSITFSSLTSGVSFRWTCDTSIGLGSSGSDSIPSFTASNLGDNAVKATITVVPLVGAGDSCTGQPTSFSITVLPAPALTSRKDTIVCTGRAFTYLAESLPKDANFTWKRIAPDSVTSTLADSGTTKTINDLLVNSTTAPKTVKYSFSLLANASQGCRITRDTFRVIVNPIPKVNPVNKLIYCSGSRVSTIRFTSPSVGTFFRWTCNATIGLGSSGSDSIPSFTAINTGSNAVEATITVVPLAGAGDSCTGESISFSITVLPIPVLTSARLDSVCDDVALPYRVTSSTAAGITTFNWSRDSVSGVNNPTRTGSSADPGETLKNTTSQKVDVTYLFTLSTKTGATTCAITEKVVISVNPTPILTRIPDAVYCNGDSVKGIPFSSMSPDSAFTWIGTAKIGFGLEGSGSISAFNATNTSDTIAISRIRVSISAKGCRGPESTFAIRVKPSPPKPGFTSLFSNPSNSTLVVCSGAQNINFNVNFPSDHVAYNWISNPGTGVTIKSRNDSTTVMSFDTPGDYTIVLASKDTNTCGAVDSQKVHVRSQTVDKPLPIFLKEPKNVLVYQDNSLFKYQWGYDTVVNTTTRSLSRSMRVQGQVYQFFVPDGRFITRNSNGSETLNTVDYNYWVWLSVLTKDSTCDTRVYYNGKYLRTITANTPAADSTVRLQIIPNPNRGLFDISLKGNIYGYIHAQIQNAAGRTVFMKSFTKALPAVTEKFNVDHLPGGVYFLILQSGAQKPVVSRFIIQR